MATVTTILMRLQLAIIVFFMLLALVYSIPVVLVRRFHNVNNIFTINFCFAVISCGIYWISFFTVTQYYPQFLFGDKVCVILSYFEMMCTLQVPLALIGMSIYRLCSVVYHTKAFFRRKRWIVICIATQWIIGIIVSLPRPIVFNSVCEVPFWVGIYGFVMIVTIPSFSYLITNIIIFKYVRSSTHRVRPLFAVANNTQHIYRRDLYLLRHMIIMFCVFIGGWSPVYLYALIFGDSANIIIFFTLTMLAELSITFDIINLFFYNHELRRYLLRKIFTCQ